MTSRVIKLPGQQERYSPLIHISGCIFTLVFRISVLNVTAVQMKVNPSDVIILEGILVLHDARVRGLMNMKIFVDTGSVSPSQYHHDLFSDTMTSENDILLCHVFREDEAYLCHVLPINHWDSFTSADSDVRLARRIQRDTVERGRNIQSVLGQVRKWLWSLLLQKLDETLLPNISSFQDEWWDTVLCLAVWEVC